MLRSTAVGFCLSALLADNGPSRDRDLKQMDSTPAPEDRLQFLMPGRLFGEGQCKDMVLEKETPEVKWREEEQRQKEAGRGERRA